MTVVVNAAATRLGGGVTYLDQIIPPLSWQLQRGGDRLVLLTGPSTAARLSTSDWAPGATIRAMGWMDWPGAPRMLLEQLLLPALLRSMNADVVFGVSDTLPLATRTPRVVLCRNALVPEANTRSLRHRLLRLLNRISLRKADAVIAVSDHLAGSLPIPPSKQVTVIHHGPGSLPAPATDLSRPGAALLSVGTLYEHKRLELAICALHRLRERRPELSLRIAGKSVERAYERHLAGLVDLLDLQTAVIFIGEVGPEELEELYRQSTALVITSTVESFCHPILEGFSALTPVVLPRDLGVGTEIAGDGALVVDPSPDGFADAIERVLDDPELVRDLTERGARRCRDFSWSKAARETASVLLSVARQTGRQNSAAGV